MAMTKIGDVRAKSADELNTMKTIIGERSRAAATKA